MINTTDPVIARLDSLIFLTNKTLKRMKREYRRNTVCLDNLKNYDNKNLFIKILYYFRNKNKKNLELKCNMRLETIKRISEELEGWVIKIGREVN